MEIIRPLAWTLVPRFLLPLFYMYPGWQNQDVFPHVHVCDESDENSTFIYCVYCGKTFCNGMMITKTSAFSSEHVYNPKNVDFAFYVPCLHGLGLEINTIHYVRNFQQRELSVSMV